MTKTQESEIRFLSGVPFCRVSPRRTVKISPKPSGFRFRHGVQDAGAAAMGRVVRRVRRLENKIFAVLGRKSCRPVDGDRQRHGKSYGRELRGAIVAAVTAEINYNYEAAVKPTARRNNNAAVGRTASTPSRLVRVSFFRKTRDATRNIF